MLLLRIWLGLGLGSDYRVKVSNSRSGPARERVEKSHVTVECRLINHHPFDFIVLWATPII